MANKQVMEITILPSGEVKLTVKCVPGAACEAVSAAIEQALGTVKNRERTTEFYEESVETTQTIGIGRS